MFTIEDGLYLLEDGADDLSVYLHEEVFILVHVEADAPYQLYEVGPTLCTDEHQL